MGRKSREKKERKKNVNKESAVLEDVVQFRSITFRARGNGKVDLWTQSQSEAYSPFDQNGVPKELVGKLRSDISGTEMNKIFELYISGLRDIDKHVDDKIIAKWLSELTNELVEEFKDSDLEDGSIKDEKHYYQFISGPPANIALSVCVDSRVANLWQPIDIDAFTRHQKGVWVSSHIDENGVSQDEKQYGLGFEYRLVTVGKRSPITDVSLFAESCEDENALDTLKVMTHDKARSTLNTFWNKLDHYILFEVNVAPYDRLPSQYRDSFSSKEFIDKNGRKVPAHNKKIPRRRLKPRTELRRQKYVVYIAKDIEGNVRYIGEGNPSRPGHVNSGTSHVYNLNREHFANRPMMVDIVAESLTKAEALAIEKILIDKYPKDQLWNRAKNC
ncbi:GIY-YIG nuclease family protein [Vibrio alginolyticus]